jgi:hypothetical protein
VSIVPVSEVEGFALKQGLSSDEAQEVTEVYTESQIDALRISLFAVVALGLFGLAASRHIPSTLVSKK